MGECEGEARIRAVRVVHEQPVGPDGRDLHDLETAVRALDDSALLLGAEANRLAVHEPDLVEGTGLLVRQSVERVIVEHRTVLVDLDDRRALVLGRLAKYIGEVGAVDVERPRHERRLRAERQCQRVERVVERPQAVSTW